MTISISVKHDFSEAERALSRAQHVAIPAARRRTLNKLAQFAKSEAVRAIRSRYTFKAATVRKSITINRANYRSLSAEVKAIGRNTPIIELGARQTKKGVTVAVSKGKRKLLKGAFISTMQSGHKGVFKRSSKAARRTKGRPATSSANLPIEEVHTIGIPHAFASIAVTNAMRKVIADRLATTYAHELGFELSRRGL